jgi:hypothetical protein
MVVNPAVPDASFRPFVEERSMPTRVVIRDVPSSARQQPALGANTSSPVRDVVCQDLASTVRAWALAMLASREVLVTNYSWTGHERS